MWERYRREATVRQLILIIAVCTGVLWGGPVGADEADDAVWDNVIAAFKRGDSAKGAANLRILAEKGDAKAQNNLGVMYDYGEGVPKDYAEAVKWYRKAAVQEDAEAQTNLGFMYLTGYGVPKDYVQAYMWSYLAVAQGNKMARKNRDIVAKRMTRFQILKAKRLAKEWEAKRLAKEWESKK